MTEPRAFPGAPERFLLIRFSSLGDVVLTLPVVRAIAGARPGAEIFFLTREAYRPLLEGQPGITRVVTLEEAGARRGPPGRACRAFGAFDVALDLHATLRSRRCLHAVEAARKVVYRKSAVLRRLWAAGWMRGRMASETRHVTDRYLEALRRAGIPAASAPPRLELDPAEVEAARERVRAAGVRDPRRFALLFPGARWPNKRWGPEGFAGVAAGLGAAVGLEPVLAGDAGDREAIEQVRARVPGGAVAVCGGLGLRELAAAEAAASLVVANDSGPAHLAAAVGTPVVALFGPTHEAFGFAPRGGPVRVLSRDLPCRPCAVHGGRGCRRGRRECLDAILPGEVLGAARELLAAAGREGPQSPG